MPCAGAPQTAQIPREVAPRDGVPAELLAQAALRRDRAAEDDQAARLLVQPLHDAVSVQVWVASTSK